VSSARAAVTRQNLSAGGEGSPMLEAVARERLKIQQVGRRLSGCCGICELWKLAVAL
jgi:hypothetical protein